MEQFMRQINLYLTIKSLIHGKGRQKVIKKKTAIIFTKFDLKSTLKNWFKSSFTLCKYSQNLGK